MVKLTFEFEVSAENKTRIIDGIAFQCGYTDQVEVDEEMVDNPESKAAFCKRMAKSWVRDNVRAWEANQAADTARDDKIAEVDAISIAD